MRDLFGEIPVLLSEIEAWLTLVPRLSHNQHLRRKSYLQGWNVVKKIQQAKLSGSFPGVMGGTCCRECGADLLPIAPDLPPTDPAVELATLQRRVEVLEMVIAAQAAASALPAIPDGLARRAKAK